MTGAGAGAGAGGGAVFLECQNLNVGNPPVYKENPHSPIQASSELIAILSAPFSFIHLSYFPNGSELRG